MQHDPAVDRYAEALFETAMSHDALDEVSADLQAFIEILEESDQLRRFLQSFRVTASDKVRVFREVFDGKVNNLLLNTLALLLKHQRGDIIPEMSQAFTEKVKTHHNIVGVHVYTARKLSADVRSQVKKALESVLNKQVELTETVDEALQGGIKLRIKNTVYDGTIAHQLAKLREQLR